MTDLAEHLKAAAIAAIDDVLPTVMAEPRKVRLLTIEFELVNGGQVRSGRAWIERGVSVSRLLSGPALPEGQS